METAALTYIPELIAWTVGIVLAAVMVRRGGGLAPKLLLAGCILKFLDALATPVISQVVTSLVWTSDISNIEKARTMSLAQLPVSILSVAGLVCIAWAFWARFWVRRREAA